MIPDPEISRSQYFSNSFVSEMVQNGTIVIIEHKLQVI